MHLYSKVKTDLGDFWIACSSRGITSVCSGAETATAFKKAYRKRFGTYPLNRDIPGSYKKALRMAIKGRPVPSVDVDWTCFTAFQRKVLKKLQKVPAGKVQTYAWLARQAGHPTAARAVGNVMAQNPIPFLIPCHRIVPASGGIGNYGLGRKLKKELLSREGIKV
jgi:methylated-DNA-[protein]-cysteine S-methyltransferase